MDTDKKITTVTGEIDPNDLGVTSSHEHLRVDIPDFFHPPPQKFEHLIDAPWEIKNLGWIRQNPYSHKPNIRFYGDGDAVIEDLLTFKSNGGKTIVEQSTLGFGGDLDFFKAMAEATGVNIISGTGFYVECHQTQSVKQYSTETMAAEMRRHLVEGVDGIKCGIIGEIGCSWPITDFEKRSLRAAATVQEELGSPVNIHPGRNVEAPEEIMRLFCEAGGKAKDTAMSHLERTILDREPLLDFANIGTYLEYDMFGMEESEYQFYKDMDMPSDGQRIAMIKTLVDNGFEDRILIGQDIHTWHRLVKYGGQGYSHILLNVTPKMPRRGISQAQVDKILIHNPRNWLTCS